MPRTARSTAASSVDVTLNVSSATTSTRHGLGQQHGLRGHDPDRDGQRPRRQREHLHGRSSPPTPTRAQGAAGALTGRDEVILQPKPKQAEFFDDDRPRRREHRRRDPGVQTEATTDAGGGRTSASSRTATTCRTTPVSLEEMPALRFRVASGGAGGNIEVRLDSPTGPLVGTVAVAEHGRLAELDQRRPAAADPAERDARAVPRVPQPADNGGLFNLNYFDRARQGRGEHRRPAGLGRRRPEDGRRAARGRSSPARRPTPTPRRATRSPTSGTSASPARPTTPRPSQTRRTRTSAPGTYSATFTATDADGGTPTATVAGRGHRRRRVPAEQPAVGRVRRRRARHEPLGHHPAGRHPSADGVGREPELPDRQRLAVRAGTTARNIIVQALPDRCVGGDGQDHDRPADRELPAGGPADLPGRRQLGVGPHDLRGHRPRLRVHLRGRRATRATRRPTSSAASPPTHR